MGRRTGNRTRLSAPVVIVAGYLAGAIPFSYLMARRSRGVDLRSVGSGTVSGTSLYRVAGFLPLAGAGVLEVAKGAVGPVLAGRDRPVLGAVAGGAAVVGHNWSVVLGGAGGRGISPALGAFLVQDPAGTVVLLTGLVAGKLAGESAVGCLIAYGVLGPVLAARKGRIGALAAAAVLVPMLAKRLAGNAPAPDRGTYLWRLVFDRDTPQLED
ncbi:MAG TPA: glycerol-3-phosphate acyltransferase [Acidimicrobiia bacterium]|nr:glycerol-3-phosphate acyltransferase [Acidimicrobiia bacterium]